VSPKNRPRSRGAGSGAHARVTRPVTVVDTGPLVALADADDTDHASCVAWLRDCRRELVIPATIVGEVCYLLGAHCGADVEASFLEGLATEGVFKVEALTPADYLRASSLVRRYADLPLGGSDAAVIALAERFATAEVATLDHRHFTVVKPEHVDAFTLVP
jgi:predicted nucleic acid-binding protein